MAGLSLCWDIDEVTYRIPWTSKHVASSLENQGYGGAVSDWGRVTSAFLTDLEPLAEVWPSTHFL